MALSLYATIGVGLETVVSRELSALGIQPTRVEPGRLRFSAEHNDLCRALIHLRCASRVIREVSFHTIDHEQDIYEVVRSIDWPRLFHVSRTFRVVFNVHSSLITHARFHTYRIKDAICDRFVDQLGARPSVDTESADVTVYCYLENRRLSVGLDGAGDPLHMRGYRVAKHPASLREHLAAAMVMQSGWDGSRALHDPFCGSGTILIEAALIATQTPPSSFRTKFGCEGWKDFDPNLFNRLRQEASDQRKPIDGLRITGADHDPNAVQGALANIETAGLVGAIRVQTMPVKNMPPIINGHVVTNPPYGIRLGDELGDAKTSAQDLRTRALLCSGSTIAVLSGSAEFEKVMSLRPSKRNRMNNGPIPCTLYQYRIGSDRESSVPDHQR